MVDAQVIFVDLISQSGTRQAKSLSVLNEVLKQQFKSGNRNFSIAEISRLSVSAGGPSAKTIRNSTGAVYRQLIEAWATQAGTNLKAPLNPLSKNNRVPKDYHLLQKIDDPALRAIFGQIIAERNNFRNELNTLKAHNTPIIDLRAPQKTSKPASPSAQALPALELNDMELLALHASISDDFFSRRGWSVSPAGQVKDEHGREIYKHGYVNALKKLLQTL